MVGVIFILMIPWVLRREVAHDMGPFLSPSFTEPLYASRPTTHA